MKKVLLSIICLFSFVFLNVKAITLPEKTDHKKITIYIFRGHTCSHCYEALEYFNKNISKYEDYFDVVAYEVWNNANNSSLMKEVAEKLEDETSGVPYIVVGNKYSVNGFKDSMAEEIIEAALSEYQNEEYEDIVAPLAKDAEKETLQEACIAEGIIEKPVGKYDAIIILGIFIFIIGGGALLIHFSKK